MKKLKASDINTILENFVNQYNNKTAPKVVNEGLDIKLDTNTYGSDIYNLEGGYAYDKESYKNFLINCQRSK